MKTYRIETLSYKGDDTIERPEIDIAEESVLFETKSKEEAYAEWEQLKNKYDETFKFNRNTGFALYEYDEEQDITEQLAEWNKYRSEHLIEATLLECRLSIKGGAELLGCPYRTLQNWVTTNESNRRSCPKWLEHLIVEELKRKCQ